mgnify:CR=1 FL=1
MLIPTYERADALADCLASVLRQTVLPDELIIVDDGDLGSIPHREDLEARSIDVVYRQKDVPGVTESRNLGAQIATGEIIYLSEDDVIMEREYIERILHVYLEDERHEIGGVGGVIVNERRLQPGRLLPLLVYMLIRACGLREGRILRSGFASDYGQCLLKIRHRTRVDFLLGGVSSFRREVLDRFQFSNRYRSKNGYGQGEDKEFSYRVSQQWRLMIEPRARLRHYPAAKKNYDRRVRGRAFVLSRYFFFKEQVQRKPLDALFFYYTLGGYTLYRLIIMLVRPMRTERERMRGLLSGWREILRGARLDQL